MKKEERKRKKELPRCEEGRKKNEKKKRKDEYVGVGGKVGM